MADISITPGSVVAGANATTALAVAGTTISAGQTIYGPATAVLLANADTTSAYNCIGIALNGGASGQPIVYLLAGDITPGATLTAGAVYVVSGNNAGGIAPVADLASGWFTNILLVAKTTAVASMVLKGANPLTAHG